MHSFIAALAGLSIAGGASAPLITNQVQDKNTSVTTTPLRSSRVDLNGVQKISTTQGSKIWEWTFSLDMDSYQINHLSFEGGGLNAHVAWGSWNWDYGYSQIDISADNTTRYVFRDDHSSGFATQKAGLTSNLSHLGNNRYHLKFEFWAESYNSFTNSSGDLTIGSALVFSS